MSVQVTISLYADLKRFIHGKVKNLQDAEDIVQEVFIRAQQKSDQLKEPEKVSAWMYSITRNSIIDYYRNKKKHLEESLQETAEEYNLFNDCVAHCIHELMKTLPEPYREAMILTEINQLSQKDLAEKLNISYSGVKSRVQRARQMIKDKMNELYHIKTDGFGNVLVCEDRMPCGCDPNDIALKL